MLAESVATYTLDGMASSDEALMEATAQLARNGCDIVACVGTRLDGQASQIPTPPGFAVAALPPRPVCR